MKLSDLIYALPEITTSIMILLMVMVASFSKREVEGKRLFALSMLTVLLLLPSIVISGLYDGVHIIPEKIPSSFTFRYTAFNGLLVIDPLSVGLKLATVLVFAVSLIFAVPYLKTKNRYEGNFFLIAWFALLGQFTMIAAGNMMSLYLGLELLALSMYALVALPRDEKIATEAAMKYFVLGALASGFLLYGISLLYGATGTLDFTDLFERVKMIQVQGLKSKYTVLVLGTVFVVAGLAFKLGAVPFHAWVPDVYQGSSTAVTLLIASAPKFAAFALLIRFLVEGLFTVSPDWQRMLMVLSIMSLIFGNLIAIVQTNLKRLLAYSTIGHVGFILLGFVAGVKGLDYTNAAKAYGSSLFYVVTYVLTTLGTFGIILILSSTNKELETLDDIKGLSKRAPWFAFMMLILMFSLAGVPPTLGFYAKLMIINTLIDAKMLWLAIVAVACSLIGAFYYIRVVKQMYFDAPTEASVSYANKKPLFASIMLTLCVLNLLIIGFLPNQVYSDCLNMLSSVLTYISM